MVGAAQAADIGRLEALIEAGGDINATYRGYRGLHALIQTKPHADAAAPSAAQLTCFRWMLAHGADPEQLGAWPPARALLVAAFMGTRDYIDALVNAGARVDVFVSAALADRAAVARALEADPTLARGRDAGGLTVLQCASASRLGRDDEAARARLLEIARLLLDAGADPHAPTSSWGHDVDAVYLAASSHHLDMFTLLLDRGADATRALVPALWNTGTSFEAFAAVALAYGARVNDTVAERRPLLNDLIRWGQFAPAKWLLDHGADPNRTQGVDVTDADGKPSDTAGWTALHQAASRGNVRMVEALIAAGGDVSRVDHAGRTPYDVARAAPLKTFLKKARSII